MEDRRAQALQELLKEGLSGMERMEPRAQDMETMMSEIEPAAPNAAVNIDFDDAEIRTLLNEFVEVIDADKYPPRQISTLAG
jgi:hypothetical protein